MVVFSSVCRLLGLAALSLATLSLGAIAEGARDKHGCADLDYSCAELVYLGFTYPFPREAGSYLFVNGAVYPYVKVTELLLEDSTVRLPSGREISVRALLTTLELEDQVAIKRTAVAAYGSNPSPQQLSRKFGSRRYSGDAVIPVMKGRLKDYDVVWTPVFVGYAALLSTITPSPGTEVDMWINWLSDEQLMRMNASEGSGHLYSFATFSGADYEVDGPDPSVLRIYVSCFGALTIGDETLAVSSVPAQKRRFSAVDESGAVRSVMSAAGWRATVLDLLYTNVTDPKLRAQRNARIRGLGVMANDPRHDGDDLCAAGNTVSGGEF